GRAALSAADRPQSAAPAGLLQRYLRLPSRFAHAAGLRLVCRRSGAVGRGDKLMDRRVKPKKGKAEAKRPFVRRPPKGDSAKARDLESLRRSLRTRCGCFGRGPSKSIA